MAAVPCLSIKTIITKAIAIAMNKYGLMILTVIATVTVLKIPYDTKIASGGMT
jgi:hypothetical protein